MRDAIIINPFCIKKTLFWNKRKRKNNVFVFFSYFPILSTLGDFKWEKEYIFYLYLPAFFKSAGKWIAILLFQVIIIVDA